MNKTHIYDLAYEFRRSKVWKQIFENELFAVKLPTKSKKPAENKIAYCSITGRGGEHMALTVYPGAESFTSFRKLACFGEDYKPVSTADLLMQDCIQCSIESRDQFAPEELDEIKAYCQKAGVSFRAPFPQITRYYPYCMPWNVSKADDWNALEAALTVTVRLVGELKRSGKVALGLRSINVKMHDEEYTAEQLCLFEEPSDDEVSVPLYSIEDDNLVIERITLPPYTERAIQPPTHFNDILMAKMMRNKQRGVYQCEIIRMPEPVDGDPPYIPALLMTVDPHGLVLQPIINSAPVYDPDEMLNDFITILGDAYPKTIKVRTAETKTLLEDFCKKAEIRLTETKHLELLDEAVDSLMAQMGCDYDDNADDDSISVDEMIEMLDAMSIDEIRMLPNLILDQILNVAQFFPEEIVRKVRKARGKKS